MANIIIPIIILLIAVLSLYVYKESTGYRIVKYSISDPRVKKDNLKIVFISDLHNNQYGDNNALVMKDIDEIKPDFICIGGDILTASGEKWAGYSRAVSFIEQLASKYKVYYGMGNHEARLKRLAFKFPEGTYENFSKELDNIGTPLLDDACINLNEINVDLYGLNLEHDFYRKVITKPFPSDHLDKKLGTIDKEKFSILLAHNPEHFKQYADWGADLVLSGHVHGGIIRLPFLGGVVSPAFKIFPKYDGGLFLEKNSRMILSRGLGSHTIPIRVNNKAELVVVEITGQSN